MTLRFIFLGAAIAVAAIFSPVISGDAQELDGWQLETGKPT